MFPVGDFSYVVYPEFAVIALVISAIAGVLASILLKLPVRPLLSQRMPFWEQRGL